MSMPITITSTGMLLTAQPLLASASAITSAQLALHLAQAEALVWAAASARYNIATLQAPVVPPLLESICIDLACYGVLVKQAIIANTLEDSPWPDRYKESMELLTQVAEGDLKLLSGSNTVIAAGASTYTYGFSSNDYLPTFTELPSEYNRLDPEKEADLIDERTP